MKKFKVPDLIPVFLWSKHGGFMLGGNMGGYPPYPFVDESEEEQERIEKEIMEKLRRGKVRFYRLNTKTGEEIEVK